MFGVAAVPAERVEPGNSGGRRDAQVEVWESPTVYKISVASLEKWLARGGGSPREVVLRQKIRGLMKE